MADDKQVYFRSPTTGAVQAVPPEHWDEALKAGYKPTSHTVMYSDTDGRAMVPNEQLRDAIQQGYQTTPKTQFEQEHAPDQNSGWWAHTKSALGIRGTPTAEDAQQTPAGIGINPAVTNFSKNFKQGEAAAPQSGSPFDRAGRAAEGTAYALAPFAGINTQGVESAAQKGDVGGVLGELTPAAVGAATPVALKLGGAAKGALSRAFEPEVPSGLSQEATANLQNPLARRSAFKIQKALAPPGANNDFMEKLGIAAPDLGAMDEASYAKQPEGQLPGQGVGPLSAKRGGIINPDLRLRQFDTNLENLQQNIATNERDPIISKYNNVPATTRDMLFQGWSPEDQAAFEQQFGNVPDTMNVGTADRLRGQVNQYIRQSKLPQMTPEGQALKLGTNEGLENLKDAENHLKDATEDAVSQYGGNSLRDINRRYAAAQEVQDAVRSRMNGAETARFGDNATLRGGLNSGLNVFERLHIAPSPGRLAEQGLTGLNESGLRPTPRANLPSEMAPPTMPATGFNGGQPYEDAFVYEDRPRPTPPQLPAPNQYGTPAGPSAPPNTTPPNAAGTVEDVSAAGNAPRGATSTGGYSTSGRPIFGYLPEPAPTTPPNATSSTATGTVQPVALGPGTGGPTYTGPYGPAAPPAMPALPWRPTESVPVPPGASFPPAMPPTSPTPNVTLYHGEGGNGGAGGAGGWFTTDPERAASYGGAVSSVEVPQDQFARGQQAARQAGSGTSGDAYLPDWTGQGRPIAVQSQRYDLGDIEPDLAPQTLPPVTSQVGATPPQPQPGTPAGFAPATPPPGAAVAPSILARRRLPPQ